MDCNLNGCLVRQLTPELAAAVSMISIGVIYRFAPVSHINVPMSEKRKRKMRMFGRMTGTAIVIFVFLFLFVFPKYVHIGIVMASGLGILSFSMLCARIKTFCFH